MKSAVVCASLSAALLLFCGAPKTREVVVYTSVDQPYSEPLLTRFEAQSGIHVRPVFDVEAAKSTGLANRVLAERGAPRADLFWSSEVAQVLRLKSEGALAVYRPSTASDVDPAYRDPGGTWTGQGLRARVILVNTERVPEGKEPLTLEGLAAPSWNPGDVGIADPLFGTSATHMAALYALWGRERARAFYAALADGGARVLPGNSTVRDLVARGELCAGLTDTDDAKGAVDAGAPVKVIYPDRASGGTFYVPGAVAVVNGAPHLREAHALADFLASADAERALLESGFLCASVRTPPPGARVSWSEVEKAFGPSRADATALFLK